MSYPEEAKSPWQRLGRCYPAALELVPLLLLGLMIYLVLSNYSALPDTIPSHFDAQGAADDWGSKKMIFLLPVIAFAIYVLSSLITACISLVEDPKSLINLPDRNKKAITQAKAEQLRVFVGRCLFAVKTLSVGLMTYIVYATIQVARGEARTLGAMFYIILGAILVCAALMVWRSLSLAFSGQSQPR